ncbi:zinc transporter 77C [Lycorma delicatula]|uniref:zinc transporter 77C n=1 Tax=Lycorma delicatula TaxID=130591 RepID=UPI003F50F450
MATVKVWFQQLRSLRLYVVLALTTAYFLTQLLVSHLTHALTLLVDSYHVLCNLIALIGCIITIKYGRGKGCDKPDDTMKSTEELKILSVPLGTVKYASKNYAQPERELRNTFGWARIDVLVMLIGCVFLASLCFSLLVEALQTLIHISHLDEMHHPIPVLYIGLTGLCLNLICYLLIGGYTYHQGSFLHITADGDVVLESVNENSISNGQRRLSSQTRRVHVPLLPPKRQGLWEMCRDIIGCFFVILSAIIVYSTEQNVAKYVDPILSIISAVLLLIFSYPYMKESCLILLQTIPDHINMESLKTELLSKFPDIVNIHDFHVWQLTVNKTISTVHIIFLNPQVYCRITDDIKKFFELHGISHVTVQPEFFKDMNSIELVSGYGAAQCLVQCLGDECVDSQCCSSLSDLRSVSISNMSKSVSKEDMSHLQKNKMNSNSLPTMREIICHKEMNNDSSSVSVNITDSQFDKAYSMSNNIINERNICNNLSATNSIKSAIIYANNNLYIENNLRNKCISEPVHLGTDIIKNNKSKLLMVDNELLDESKNQYYSSNTNDDNISGKNCKSVKETVSRNVEQINEITNRC